MALSNVCNINFSSLTDDGDQWCEPVEDCNVVLHLHRDRLNSGGRVAGAVAADCDGRVQKGARVSFTEDTRVVHDGGGCGAVN